MGDENKRDLKKDGPGSGSSANGSILGVNQYIVFGVILLLAVFAAYNQMQLSGLQAKLAVGSVAANVVGTSNNPASGSSQGGATGTGSSAAQLAQQIMPKGVPPVYGAVLGVSFDNAAAAIQPMSNIDKTVTLSGSDLTRYISIASQISCEYCCGAQSIIFPNGQAACACEHSYAMRGVIKYLIKNHGNEFTDQQILGEAGKWKMVFFPGPIVSKAMEFQKAGKDLNVIDLTSNKYRGFKAPSSGSSSSTGLPGQVGGC